MDLYQILNNKTSSVEKLENEWIWGPTGTGKSMDARTRFPGAYLKGANKWWDGYNLQDTVLLEELGYTDEKGVMRSQISAYHLKQWADHWPFTAESKGSTIQIRPKRLIVTSNYHP